MPKIKQLKNIIQDNGFTHLLPTLKESTDFVKEDLEFIKKNEAEILDLEEGLLIKFEIVLSREDEILINQIEQSSLTSFVKEDLDFIKKNEEEIKDLEQGIENKHDIILS
jgi:hypothetical protein